MMALYYFRYKGKRLTRVSFCVRNKCVTIYLYSWRVDDKPPKPPTPNANVFRCFPREREQEERARKRAHVCVCAIVKADEVNANRWKGERCVCEPYTQQVRLDLAICGHRRERSSLMSPSAPPTLKHLCVDINNIYKREDCYVSPMV